MSHKVARSKINRARALLSRHYSRDPAHELDPERIVELQKEIELAGIHLEDEPDDLEILMNDNPPARREDVT